MRFPTNLSACLFLVTCVALSAPSHATQAQVQLDAVPWISADSTQQILDTIEDQCSAGPASASPADAPLLKLSEGDLPANVVEAFLELPAASLIADICRSHGQIGSIRAHSRPIDDAMFKRGAIALEIEFTRYTGDQYSLILGTHFKGTYTHPIYHVVKSPRDIGESLTGPGDANVLRHVRSFIQGAAFTEPREVDLLLLAQYARSDELDLVLSEAAKAERRWRGETVDFARVIIPHCIYTLDGADSRPERCLIAVTRTSDFSLDRLGSALGFDTRHGNRAGNLFAFYVDGTRNVGVDIGSITRTYSDSFSRIYRRDGTLFNQEHGERERAAADEIAAFFEVYDDYLTELAETLNAR